MIAFLENRNKGDFRSELRNHHYFRYAKVHTQIGKLATIGAVISGLIGGYAIVEGEYIAASTALAGIAAGTLADIISSRKLKRIKNDLGNKLIQAGV